MARQRTVVVQVELHTIPWLDQGGGSHFEALSYEVRYWSLGTNFGDRLASWEANPATERPNTASPWSTVLVRCFLRSLITDQLRASEFVFYACIKNLSDRFPDKLLSCSLHGLASGHRPHSG